ncbi:MAG: leucine-rich repeat protein [Clostridia bacterium]|nr:leucine-rich repeat protein [Clostridia bacterium]
MKKLIAVLLASVLLFTAAPLAGFAQLDIPAFKALFQTAEAAASGTCGENLTWTADDDGNIVISGTGAMDNYSAYYYTPWNRVPNITTVTITSGVTSVGSYAFWGCNGLKSISLPDTLTTIKSSAFYKCTALTSVFIPASVTEIGYYAFYACKKLSDLRFAANSNLTSLDTGVFRDCDALAAVALPAGLKEFDQFVFADCDSLRNFTIPASVEKMSYSVFSYCKNLVSVTVEKGSALTSLPDGLFSNCSSLQSFSIPAGVENIPSGCFSDCSALEFVDVPSSVNDIDIYAFYGCKSLKTLNIDPANRYYLCEDGVVFNKNKTELVGYLPGREAQEYVVPDCVEDVGSYAFALGCENLRKVTLPDGLQSIRSATFANCPSLTQVIMPDSVETIGSRAFYNCTALSDIELSEKLKSISEYAFDTCTSLVSINFPESFTYIGKQAFYGCTGLRSVGFAAGNFTVSSGAFTGCALFSDIYFAGNEADWATVKISSGNSYFESAKIHFNSPNGTAGVYAATAIDTLILNTRNTDGWLSGSVGNESLVEKKGSLNWKMANATAKIGDKTFTQDEKKNITIAKSDITDDIILSHKDYYNYIIPKEVALSFMGTGLTNIFEFTAYMKKEVKNGKPYVSTVFARQDGMNGAYIDIRHDKLTVADNTSYTFYITAGNPDEAATYYLSQDDAHKVESSTGCFSIDYLSTVLQNNKTTYAYFVTDSGDVSDAVEVKLNFENPENNSIVKELRKGKLNIGGKEGLSITLPEDWLLVGGSTIDLCDWSFPVGVQVEGNEVRVSVGFDLWTKEETTKTSYASIDKETQQEYISKSTTEYKTTTVWENIKSGVKDSGNAFKNALNKAEAVRIKKQLCARYGVDVQDLAASNVGKTKTNVSALGYIEGNVVNGKFIVTDMYISVAGEFTISYTVQLTQGYLGLEGGGKLTVSTNWSRVTADVNLPLEFGFAVNVTPEIKARGGVGWDGLASAGVYGKGTMPTILTFKDKKLSVAITGEFGYEAQVLVWSTGEKALLSGTFGPKEFFFGKSSVERARTLQAHGIKTEDVGTAQDVYTLTERKQTSAWFGNNHWANRVPNRVGVSSAEELTFKTLQTDVFRLSDAKIITAGNTTLAAWVTEDAARDDYNRLKLVYSVYSPLADSWSEPKAIYDDGFMDASPVLASDGEKIFVAWQKYCKEFTAENSADIADVLASAEIYVAEYDVQNDVFFNATRITNDTVYDYRPALSVKDGNAVLAYATAANNALMSATGNSITKFQNGGKTVLAENLPTVNNLACAVINDKVQIAYSVDTDGDLQSTADISVFCGTDTFAEFPKFYENDPLTNFVFADFNGETILFVSDGLNIYYNNNGKAVAILEEETVISSQLQAVNEAEGLAFWWLASCENGNELYSCGNMDGEWSNAICLSDRNNELSNLAVTVADSQVLGIANETLVSYDEATQTYTKGTANFVCFKENDCFDLAMQAVELDEANLQIGETAFLEVTAENVGNVKAGRLTFTVTDTNGIQKKYLVETELLPGKSVIWQIPYVVPNNMAETTVTVTVSCDYQLDSDLSNNAVACAFAKSALVVMANEVTNVDNVYILTADVTNVNFVAAQDVAATVTFNDANGTPVSNTDIGNIGKDELAVVEFAFTENDLVFDKNGVCVVYVTIAGQNAESVVCAYTIGSATAGYTLGDIDSDGIITAGDARIALRASVGLENLNEQQQAAADADGDNLVTAGDARLLLRVSVGLETLE